MRLWMALPRAIEHSGEKMLHLDFNPPFLEKRKQLLNMKHLQSRQMLGPGTGHGLQVQLRMAYTPSRIARASRHTLTPQLHPRLGVQRARCASPSKVTSFCVNEAARYLPGPCFKPASKAAR